MNWFVFKILLPSLFICSSFIVHAQDDMQTKRAMRHIKFWNSMIPKYTKLQYAGSMGMLSLGTGWNYGKDHWETDILFGLVPRNSDHHAMVTFTIKQNYLPWRIPIKEKFMFEPLTCGLYMNSLLDRDFWGKDPERYPSGYYWFSTRIRTHVFIGERLTLNLDSGKWPGKSLTFFYEISSCDLYIISRVKNHVLKPKDYMSLSFGVKIQIL